MTDKAYTPADLVIFGVHPCFLRFFYDLPTILNTCITLMYSWIDDEKAGETVQVGRLGRCRADGRVPSHRRPSSKEPTTTNGDNV
ncbi:hypothetical protein AB0I35_10490 [Nocardia sp. NPDC050378]|uniref:hypothetical protein n=1 Tax=Nocardia sp. NPDC050378 TaxID=3155400 RepID=UPI003405AA47